MSTWKAAVYRDDAFQALGPHVEKAVLRTPFMLSLLDFRVEHPGNHDVPAGVVAGNMRNLVELGKVQPAELLAPLQAKPRVSAALSELVRTLPEARFGLHGIYHFVNRFRSIITAPSPLTKHESTFCTELFAFGSAGSYRTSADVRAKSPVIIKAYEATLVNAHGLFTDILKVSSASRSASHQAAIRESEFYNRPLPDIRIPEGNRLRGWRAVQHRQTLMLVDPMGMYTYVFTPDDITRLEKILKGVAQYRLYFATYGDMNEGTVKKMVNRSDRLVEVLFDCMGRTTKDSAPLLCRAFDVVYQTYLAMNSTDINTTALQRQNAKWRKEELGNVVDKNSVLACVRDLHFRDALEVLSIHKMLPQPDFDYFGAAARQEEKYNKPSPHAEQVEDSDTGRYAEMLQYYEYTMIRAFYARHGYCPGRIPNERVNPDSLWMPRYPHIDPKNIPFRQIGVIQMDGAFEYVHAGSAVLDYLKDKGMAVANIADIKSEVEYGRVPLGEKNFLMWALTRNIELNIDDMRNDLDALSYDVKADDKPEAKKPFGRWFFSAHGNIRLVQSEYEENVSNYAKHAPGVVAGRGVKEVREKMNNIAKPRPEAVAANTKPLHISFDLDAFSPSYPGRVHRDTDAINARLFGVPSLARAHDIHSRGNIHYIKRTVHHTFPKPDRDFEGISGKKNTLWHTAVMGYAVRRCKELGLVSAGAQFACLIDDGALRLDLDATVFDECVPRILTVIEKVYRLAGWAISWDKTFVSSHLSVFLNDVRYDGTLVSPGVRAFLKITHREEAVAASFPGELATLEATTRGAIAANGFLTSAYAMYCYGVMDLCRRWGSEAFRHSAALPLVAFAPVALGGFGMQTMLALSANVATDALTEGIGRLRSIVTRFPNMRQGANRLVNQEMRQMSVEAQVRAPLAVRREGRVLKSVRAKAAIAAALLTRLNAPVVRSIIGGARQSFGTAYSQLLVRQATVPVEVITLLWQSSTEHAADTLADKFLRSRTAMALVPVKKLLRVAIANKTEARALIDEWCKY